MKWLAAMAVAAGLAFAMAHVARDAKAETKVLDQASAMKTMVQWNKDLGVKCQYCHTSDMKQSIESLEGKTASAEELNALLHRRIALEMESMRQMVNEKQETQFTCATCHQGSATISTK